MLGPFYTSVLDLFERFTKQQQPNRLECFLLGKTTSAHCTFLGVLICLYSVSFDIWLLLHRTACKYIAFLWIHNIMHKTLFFYFDFLFFDRFFFIAQCFVVFAMHFVIRCVYVCMCALFFRITNDVAKKNAYYVYHYKNFGLVTNLMC